MRRIKQLVKLVNGNWAIFIFTIVLTVFHRATFSYVPLFSQYLIQKLEETVGNATTVVNLPKFIMNFVEGFSDIMEVVVAIILSLIIWQIVRYVVMYFEARIKGTLGENIGKKLRLESYDHIQNLSYNYHNNADSGDLIQRVTSDIDTTTNFMSYRIMDAIGLFSSIIFGAYQMYFINTGIMTISLLFIPITAISSVIYFKKIDKLFTIVEQKESNLMVVIQENVSASRVVKAFANEAYEIEKLEEKNIEFREAEIKTNKVSAMYWGIMDFLMMIQFLLVLMLGVYYAQKGTMDIASISSALMLAGMLIWPVRGLGRIINDFGKSLVAAGRLKDIFEESSEYSNDGVLTPEITGDIEFKDVSFRFDENTPYLLTNVNFTINSGETVAFIGKTGSGKSTIINLLLKMYDYEGSIKVDGVELREISKKHVRSSIGTVLQDPFLYSKTVYENIAIANPNSSYEEVINASKLASLESDISTFQNGYETIVGEQGTTLSGGQKQRVAIARILVSDKPIIIFDDALSALDNKTDLEIRNSLKIKRENQTSLIVTHRMTTAKDADKIIVINNGTIEAVGTHKTLSKQKGLYKNLWNIQGKLEEEFLNMIKDGN